MSTQTIWYTERAAGIVGYVLVTLLVVIGLMLSNRVRTRRWPMFAIEDVHRFVGILAGVFVALHVTLILFDTFIPFSLGQVLVPFTASYRPLATGLGTVALELLIAVAIANALRRRIPHRLWRGVHYLGFAVWATVTVHGLTAGSDRHDLWLLAIYIISVTAVLSGLIIRVSSNRPELGQALGLGGIAAAVIVGILAVLPAAAAPSRKSVSASPRTLPHAYRGTLTAQIEQQDGGRNSLLSIAGQTTGSRGAQVRIDLLGNAFGIARTSLQVKFPNAETCVGTVSRLGPDGFAGDCSTADGQNRTVQASWTVDRSTNTVNGRLALT
jgi:sulfoxide reductase heme-binding subunit YedZ